MKSTIEKYFLDTNFLVYCFSEDEPEKRERCLHLLQTAKTRHTFAISTQVVNEFTSVMLSKFKKPPLMVKAIVEDLTDFEVVSVTIPVIVAGIDIHLLHQISFWDSLIVAAAKTAHCSAILTEDLQDGQRIGGLTIQNPFTLTV